jgi:hypothetical protein
MTTTRAATAADLFIPAPPAFGAKRREALRWLQDRIEAIDAGAADFEPVTEEGLRQRQVHVGEIPPVIRAEYAIDGAGDVAQADGEPAAGLVRFPGVGVFIDEGGNSWVLGKGLNSVDQLREHGSISRKDAAIVGYLLLYLSRAVEL